PLHALLAFLLLLEELALAADVAAVALGKHVLAQRRNGLARDDLIADRPCSATSNICRGISFRSREMSSLPRSCANSLWTIMQSASTGSPATSTSSRTIGDTRKPANW